MPDKKKIAAAAAEALEELYPEALCSLTYTHAYELMIAGRLSAQCTDARVNIVTKELFEKYPTLKSFADAEIDDVAEIVRPCGLYKTKAKSIVEMSHTLYYELDGIIPDTIEELTKLSGIGRKTANLIMGDIHKKPAIVADTHCIRINNRFGLTKSDNPVVVEKDLKRVIPPEKSSDYCHRMVLFGRDTCTARSPKCSECQFLELIKKKIPDFKCHTDIKKGK